MEMLIPVLTQYSMPGMEMPKGNIVPSFLLAKRIPHGLPNIGRYPQDARSTQEVFFVFGELKIPHVRVADLLAKRALAAARYRGRRSPIRSAHELHPV